MRTCLAILILFALVAAAQAPSAAPAQVMIVTPDKINWKPAPAGLPAGAQVAVLTGDPASDGFFVLRLKMPDGYKIPPHWHPVTENTTVLSGEMLFGTGDVFDESKMQALPAGSMVSVPANQHHFAMAKGESIIQTQGMGPFKRVYVNPADELQKK